ncbi:MAG: metallophosphoesterase [Planctomycetes bacterium]|nr:metallophosphoesterase [Planctomycetota bacterium]
MKSRLWERQGMGYAHWSHLKPVFLAMMVLATSWMALGRTCATEAESAVRMGKITKGPCLLRVMQDRVALMWETDTKQPSGVSYGPKGGPQAYRQSTAERLTYQGTTVYIHKLWIEDLQPGRTYDYQITGPNRRSETFEFHTTPAETNEVRFIVYGDTRTQPEVHRKLVEQMRKHPVDFIIHGGDLVASGDDYRLWGPQFFEPLQGLVERVPIYAAKGNHEGRGGTFEKLLVPPGGENDFSLDYGPLHYFCLNNVSSKKSAGQLVNQIAQDAAASRAAWKFVTYHIPSINFGGHISVWQQSRALRAFSESGIDFVVTGHSHQYERFRPIEPPGEGSYVTYITAGGGGAPLASVEPTPCHACAQAVYHFCLFHIRAGHLTMDTIDAEGRTIDHLDITKTAGRLDESYRARAIPVGSIPLCRSLCAGVSGTLSRKPEKGQPFTVSFDVVVPPLPGGAVLTLALRGEGQAYRLPPPSTTMVSAAGGRAHGKLVATLLVAPQARQGTPAQAAPIEPALWIDCHYTLGGTEETFTRPIVVGSPSILERLLGG